MSKTVYLDNSATTKPCEGALKAMTASMENAWGNPSSLHSLGMQAEECVFEARKRIAEFLKCRDDEIFFTSGGTEGNNTAIFGAARARKKRGNRIVTTSIEHPSVLEAIKQLEDDGFEIIKIPPQKNGNINPDRLYEAINDKTVLVSIMLVNNETGAVLPVNIAADAIKKAHAPALLHCDAVQAFGKLPIDLSKLNVDIMTVSGHKIHAPKGIGFLYIKKGITIKPLLVGGGQEKGMRSGTEPVPLICAIHGAVAELPDIKVQFSIQQKLCNYAKEALSTKVGAVINSSDDSLPYVLNISIPGYRSETMLHFLESYNIFVSSGSACSKGQGSYVLKEMKLDEKLIDSALRISFSRFNTKEDIDSLCYAIKSATERLRKAN